MDTVPPDDFKWRCLRAKPKSEHLAARHLRKAGYEAFCPRIRHQRKTVRGLVWFVEALFPGYLFCRFSVRENLRHVSSTAFVSQVMTFMHDAGAIPDSVLESLRAEFSEDGDETLTIHTRLVEGDSVEIVSGPLRGASATVSRILPGAERVRVLLEFIGGLREIEVPLLDLLGFRDARVAAAGRDG